MQCGGILTYFPKVFNTFMTKADILLILLMWYLQSTLWYSVYFMKKMNIKVNFYLILFIREFVLNILCENISYQFIVLLTEFSSCCIIYLMLTFFRKRKFILVIFLLFSTNLTLDWNIEILWNAFEIRLSVSSINLFIFIFGTFNNFKMFYYFPQRFILFSEDMIFLKIHFLDYFYETHLVSAMHHFKNRKTRVLMFITFI